MKTADICAAEAGESSRPKSIVLQTPAAGMLWFGGWLFTAGFAHLVWWKVLLGLCVWPYFLGVAVR